MYVYRYILSSILALSYLASLYPCLSLSRGRAHTVALPFDTIKSVVQVQGVSPATTTTSQGMTSSSSSSFAESAANSLRNDDMIKAALRLIRQEGGIWRLFRGWQGAFGRAIPGSATTLATFDLVKERL